MIETGSVPAPYGGRGAGQNPDHPVKEVTWYGAAAYCNWLSQQEGLSEPYDLATWVCNEGDPYRASGYRLPTDAEWEYAARYNDGRIHAWGNEPPTCARANRWSQPDGCVGWSRPVGSYPAEKVIGGKALYDMAGNVWEWCNDWHQCVADPSAIDPPGPPAAVDRVLRGGSWTNIDYEASLRSSYRYATFPDTGSFNNGLRVARTVDP